MSSAFDISYSAPDFFFLSEKKKSLSNEFFEPKSNKVFNGDR